MWTVLLICFLYGASTIPTPLHYTTRQVVQEADSYCWGPRNLKINTGSWQILCSYSFSFSNQCSSGEDARIDPLQNCSIRCPGVSAVLDCSAGSLYHVSISDCALLQLLQRSKRDCERLAALHCALLYFQHTEDLEMQVGKEPPLNFFPVIDVLYKAGAGHEWHQPREVLIHLAVPRGSSAGLP